MTMAHESTIYAEHTKWKVCDPTALILNSIFDEYDLVS